LSCSYFSVFVTYRRTWPAEVNIVFIL
jgi:hypothetical protein